MIELNQLQDGSPARFCDWPNTSIPRVSAGVYTIWDDRKLIYVGMAGRELTHQAIANGRLEGKTEKVCGNVWPRTRRVSAAAISFQCMSPIVSFWPL